MALSKEIFDTLPDAVKADYTEHDGAFVPTDSLKVSKLKDSLNGLDSKLKDYEKNESAKLEAARAEALDKLKKEGKVDEILADAERRIGETTKQFEERYQRMAESIKTEKRSAIVSDLAAELATDKGSKAFKKLVSSRVDVDPESGKVTFLNEDGSASSLDLSGFKAELLKSDDFEPLLKSGIVTSGGGKVNGSTGQGSAFTTGNFAGSRAERAAAIKQKYRLPE